MELEYKTVENALNEIYRDALMSDEVQEFAEKHSGKEIEAVVSIELKVKDTGCSMIRDYPGYLLRSE